MLIKTGISGTKRKDTAIGADEDPRVSPSIAIRAIATNARSALIAGAMRQTYKYYSQRDYR